MRNRSFLVTMALAAWLAAIPVHAQDRHERSLRPATPARVPAAPARATATRKAWPPAVVMYGTRWCSICAQARAYFRARNVAFVEHDVEASLEAYDQYERLGGGGVPIITVNESVLIGFSPGSFEEAVEYHRP